MSRRLGLCAVLLTAALVGAACSGSSEPELGSPEVSDTETPTGAPTPEPTDRPLTATAADLTDEFGRTGTVGDVDDLLLVTPLEPEDRRFGILCAVAGNGDAVDDSPSETMPELFEAPDQWFVVDPDTDLVVGDRQADDPFDLIDLQLTLQPASFSADPTEAPESILAEVGMAALLEASLQFGDDVFLGLSTDGRVVFGYTVSGGNYDLFLRCDRWEEDLDLMDEFIDEWFEAEFDEWTVLASLAGFCECDGPTANDLADFLASI